MESRLPGIENDELRIENACDLNTSILAGLLFIQIGSVGVIQCCNFACVCVIALLAW